MRQQLTTRTDVPQWLTDTVVLPFYDAYLGPLSPFLSFRLNGTRPATTRKTTTDVVLIDMRTLRIVPFSAACWQIAQRVPFLNAARYFWAFHGHSAFGLFVHTDVRVYALLGSAAVDRAQAASVLLSAYCMPLSLLLLSFALHVVKKALDVSDSHIYHYHKALSICDGLMAILVFMRETYLWLYLAVPFCLAWPYAFFPALDVALWLKMTNERLDDVLLAILAALVCFAYTIQSVLAVDRFAAIYFPMNYQRIANVPKVKRFILAAVVLNCAELVAELSTTSTAKCMAAPDQYACGTIELFSNGFPYGKLPRWFVMLTAFIGQLVLCSAVFVKMLARFRGSEQHNAGAISRKLVPFYLLLGTCGVGLIGLLFEISMIMLEFASTIATKALDYAVQTTLLAIRSRFRISVLSGCSSWSVLLHLLVSSHCRAAARAALAVGRSRLTQPCKRLRAYLGRKKQVMPGGHVAQCATSSSNSAAADVVANSRESKL